MEKKMTAVRWMEQELLTWLSMNKTDVTITIEKLNNVVKQALSMEREQMEKSFMAAHDLDEYSHHDTNGVRQTTYKPTYPTFPDYFTQNYGDEK